MDVHALANKFVRLDFSKPSRNLACVVEQSSLVDSIKARQFDSTHFLVLKDTVQRAGAKKFLIGDDGVLRLQGQICVSNVDGLRELILDEAHSLRYSILSYVTKMYLYLKQHYWWRKMKKVIVGYVSQRLNCQQVKYEHQKPSGLTHKLVIPEWKWERITVDFVVDFPQTFRKYDNV
ncbi:uncharacterized protein LOC107808964 [Nicotiana tabacum]|uniref:Uncharacterized protein LOC107808964 n=1 Tax=Nicotiana tabacum TaxID=4097 RepID=A0A1S4BJH7_TOBAC